MSLYVTEETYSGLILIMAYGSGLLQIMAYGFGLVLITAFGSGLLLIVVYGSRLLRIWAFILVDLKSLRTGYYDDSLIAIIFHTFTYVISLLKIFILNHEGH